jgi:isoleucyl-tRNA synthetase
MSNQQPHNQKSDRALVEEEVLTFWKENTIFEKAMQKDSPQGEFVFYEGPPTANAKPALHHLEARAFKDVIPRYKTMQGYHVARRAGWDTHGLPVELQIEKALGLQSKKDIEAHGVAAFNKACKDSVFTHIKDWEVFTDRMGYWVDKKSAYYTFNASYMESLWNIVAEINKKGLLYKDYKIVPWCPRCGTGLSSHELAQGYEDVKDLSVYAKFMLDARSIEALRSSGLDIDMSPDTQNSNTSRVSILAWTTTPWTLPGNVALAVGNDVEYVLIHTGEEYLILAKERLSLLEGENMVVGEMKGSELVGLEYEPLYPYLKEKLLTTNNVQLTSAFKVYAADFVTTTDGTGVVHIAPMYGADDFELATKVGLPKMHTVDDSGHFVQGTDFLEGRFVKTEDVAVDIIKDLAHRGLLFKKEKYEHTYPHCWRCKTPLLYYARDSWYVRMTQLREELLAANETINWEPDHIKKGRFGEWLDGVKDWAFSRERYWGTPLPVWESSDGERIVVDSIATLKSLSKRSANRYFVMRHGQTHNNVQGLWSVDGEKADTLTEEGKVQVGQSAERLKKEGITHIIASPFPRTQETAQLVADALGIPRENIITDSRLAEWHVASSFNGKPFAQYFEARNSSEDRYQYKIEDGESYADVITRSGAYLYDIDKAYEGKNILTITHGAVARALELHTEGIVFSELFTKTRDYKNFDNAEVRELDFAPLPHNETFELDLHKPYIDEVSLVKDGKEFTRVKEVMDVWFDSGSMPFAQEHYMGGEKLSYPADFISEAIDQTRGWFYTLLAVGVLMGRGTPYKNVICLGHLLDKDGKKMSKSIGNIVEPFEQIEKFGVDVVRWWMYSINAAGESKNYDEKNVAEIGNKVFGLLGNVLSFYELYRDKEVESYQVHQGESTNVLDQWILARLVQVTQEVTVSLDAYDIFKPTRALRDFIDDVSTWYLRRSRDRLKDGDRESKQTLYTVLKTTAQLMAPFAPFFAESVWQKLKAENDTESVHLSTWPTTVESGKVNVESTQAMEKVRNICTEGNALRKKLGIPVRQPLASLFVKDWNMGDEYKMIILEELNVKDVVEGEETKFDTIITPELKLEGEYRELVRTIQDLRKEKGLQPQDVITLTLPLAHQSIVDMFGDELKKTVGAKEIVVEGEEIILN